MKKFFINDKVGFLVLLFLLLCLSTFLCLSLAFAYTQPDPMAAIIICSITFGSLSLVCLIWLLVRTEIIFVCDTRVICFRFAKKRSVIDISDIREIKNIKRLTYGIDGHRYDCWQILSSSGHSISIVRTGKRKRLIDFIKNQLVNN